MVGGWYADPASGALLDLVSVGLLSGALFGLLRRRSPTVALGSVAQMIAGWTSTLLDRLVMHSLTAPGSVRGAIDFIGVGHCFYNVADLVIVGSSMLLVLWVGYRCLWVRVAARVRSAAIPARSVDSGPIPEEPSPRRSSDCPHRTV